jgi:hypothetical protein
MDECVCNDIGYLDRCKQPSNADGEVLRRLYHLRPSSHRVARTRDRFSMGFLRSILATAGQWLSAMRFTRSCRQSLVTLYASCIPNMQSSGHIGMKGLVAARVVSLLYSRFDVVYTKWLSLPQYP